MSRIARQSQSSAPSQGKKPDAAYPPQALREAELRILRHLDEYCRQNGICYIAGYGTVLGAVRHGGFIPWDDDIDVVMPREDYERFLREYQNEENAPYFLQHFSTEKSCPTYFAKLRLNGTVFDHRETGKVRGHKGIFVDIFPLDRVPGDAKRLKSWYRRHYFWNQLYIAKSLTRINRPLHGLSAFAAEALRKVLHVLLLPIPKASLFRRLDRHSRRYLDAPAEETVWGTYFEAVALPKGTDLYFPPRKMRFEDMQIPVPHQTAAYLKYLYGDWQALPPESERVGHRPQKLILPAAGREEAGLDER